MKNERENKMKKIALETGIVLELYPYNNGINIACEDPYMSIYFTVEEFENMFNIGLSMFKE